MWRHLLNSNAIKIDTISRNTRNCISRNPSGIITISTEYTMPATPRNKQLCITTACENTQYASKLCTACYARSRYWHRKPLREKMKRLQNLQRYKSTIEADIGSSTEIKSSNGSRRTINTPATTTRQ